MIITRKSKDILAINLKYYRYQSNLSQEKFAEAIDTTFLYEYQLEKGKRNPSVNMLDKLSTNISKLLDCNITSADLLSYYEKKIISSKRIDKRNSN